MKKKLISGIVAALFTLAPCASFGALSSRITASGGLDQMMHYAAGEQSLSPAKAKKSVKKKNSKKSAKKAKVRKHAHKKKIATASAPKP